MGIENSMVKSEYSFWQLIKEYSIEIPIIQRDYAQGRLTRNETIIRNELLESVYSALAGDVHLDFDFVYGTVKDNILFPLDGQQRLTTLFLLHWYFAEKDGLISIARPFLRKFSYTTRVSSRDFCSVLVNLDYKPEIGMSPSAFIKDQNKYFRSWDTDPTIIAMLEMLDAIHEKFFSLDSTFNTLISEDAPITFHYLPMEQYALTDDLYIKMNARGKALSSFENFKAKFIQHLRKNDLPITHFEKNVDGSWVDLLWDYRSDDNTIDMQFMNLFCYITEMIYLLTEDSPQVGDSPFKLNDIRTLIDYYSTEEKINLLYSILDLWSNSHEVAICLDSIFCSAREDGKVRLFDIDGSTNLFGQIVIGKQVSLANKIILFGVIMRLIKYGKDFDLSEMRDFVRVSRNFLIKNRSFIKNDCRFELDLRFGRQGPSYTKFIINQLCVAKDVYAYISDDSFYKDINTEITRQEKRKAALIKTSPMLKPIIQALEDLDCFRSCLFNILDYIEESEDLFLADELDALFRPEYSVRIIQAMLSIGDYGIKYGGSFLGDRYFYGNKEQWYEILTYPGDSAYRKVLYDFVWSYQNSDAKTIVNALDEIIETNLKYIDKTDWRYCLIKYSSTLDNVGKLYKPKIAFAFENTGTMTILHRMNKLSLLSSHTIPEYIEAAKQLIGKCNPDVFGGNSDDTGKIIIEYSSPKTGKYQSVWVKLDEDGELRIYIDYENELEVDVKKRAEIKYSNEIIQDKDLVEKLVIMGNIAFDELKSVVNDRCL